MGYCMPIMNFNFMQPMPFFGCNFMPQIPIFPTFFGMFNPMQFSMQSFMQNPWASMGWTPSFNNMPINNFGLFNQSANMFAQQPTNYFANCNFTNIFTNNASINTTSTNCNTTSTNSNTSSSKAYYSQNYTAISDKVKEYGANAKFIEKLHPAMQEKIMKLADYAKSKGISFTITSGFRSPEQQKALQGKNSGGKKVAAAVGSSPHEYGIAIDFQSSNRTELGKYARDVLGMRWGHDFKNWTQEDWHIDMSNTIQKVKA